MANKNKKTTIAKKKTVKTVLKKAPALKKKAIPKSKALARKKESSRNEIKNVGGFPLSNGVFVRGDSGLVVAMADRYGKVETIPFRIKNLRKDLPFLFLPFLRGATIFLESLYYSLKVLFLKRGFVKKGLRSKTKFERVALGLNRYLNYTILFLIAVAFVDYLLLRIGDISVKLGGDPFYEFLTSLIFILILFFVSLFFIFDRKNESELFKYHGAEHMVLDDVTKKGYNGPVISEKCSTSLFIWSMIFLAAIITFLGSSTTSIGSGMVVVVLAVLASFSLSYEVMRVALTSEGSLLKTIFIKPFSWMQYLFIQVPEKRHIDVVRIALEELKKIEKE